MARYSMDDGTVVDTKKATELWEEDTRWDGKNYISVATGSQWDHEQLYRSRKGRYYVTHWSQWQGSTPRAEWVSLHQAATWLLANGCDENKLPDDLKAVADDVTE